MFIGFFEAADDPTPATQEGAGAKAVPVLICTADAELVQREAEQLARLAAGVVLKPFDLDEFLACVVACQRQSVPIPEVMHPLQLAFPECAVIAPGMEP